MTLSDDQYRHIELLGLKLSEVATEIEMIVDKLEVEELVAHYGKATLLERLENLSQRYSRLYSAVEKRLLKA